MMINKRLIGTVKESKKYIALNVAIQWCSLAANVVMMAAISVLLASMAEKNVTRTRIYTTIIIAAAAVVIRFLCAVGMSKMSYLSSKAVKKTLREKIYEKLLKLGTSYQEKVQTSEVVQVAVEGVDQLETYFGAYLPQFFYAMIAPLTLFVILCFINVPSAVVPGGIDAVSGIISGVTTFFIGFVFSIYVLFQKETLARQLKKVMYALMPEQTNKKILEVMQIADTTFSNFLSGQCLEACILGSMFVISMTILRMPYAVLIGVLIAVTALIPIVGAFIGCIVGALLICMSNPLQALAFIILFLVLQQIEGNLIYPHVVGSSVGLPGIWVLVAVTVGGSLFGVAGMLTFIPLCSVAYALFRVYINRKADEKSVKNTEI